MDDLRRSRIVFKRDRIDTHHSRKPRQPEFRKWDLRSLFSADHQLEFSLI
jgi:hypothetical protein